LSLQVLRLEPPHLVHIVTRGGILTEESLIRLRDNPLKDPTFEYQDYTDDDEAPLTARKFEEKVASVWEWCKERWDEIAPVLEDFSISDLRRRWIGPFFEKLGYKPVYQPRNEVIRGPTKEQSVSIHLSHRGWGSSEAPRIHTVLPTDYFDAPTESDRNKQSPHDAMQRFLVLSPDVIWGIVSNGKQLRLLRKYYHEYSRGYVEFDLENILADRNFSEFRLMYMLIHASRFRPRKDKPMLMESFFERSRSTGVKIGEKLRDNFKEALEILGNDLLSESEKRGLEDEPEEVAALYAEMLRYFYRIVFILYAEQRGMLPGAGTLYSREYSITRLRTMAEMPIHADAYVDLWRGLQRTFGLVERGCDALGVTAYNGDLFDSQKTPRLNELACRNDTLLHVIRLLTTTEEEGVRQRISFIDIDVEEIGAVYESLLDYKAIILSEPRVIAGETFLPHRFVLIPQSLERKTTGSYYTDKRLVSLLLKTALVPVVDEKLREVGKAYGDTNSIECRNAKIEALLDLKVCDPACGGGTFLIAALDYLGKRVAQLQSGFEEPTENQLREARRLVLQHCIYGVDRNPLAVELAKISLWLHAFVQDKPLNFLDHHLKCGDSLIGARPYVLKHGIKEEAFEALPSQKSTGIPAEDKKVQNRLRKITRGWKGDIKKVVPIVDFVETSDHKEYLEDFKQLSRLSENSPQEVATKAAYFKKIVSDRHYLYEQDICDAWVSSFFWPINVNDGRVAPTEPAFRDIVRGRGKENLKQEIKEIVEQHRFFHWDVKFPDVFEGKNSGFDCILTNPPWEVLAFNEREFFTGKALPIEEAETQALRRKAIKKLLKGSEKEKKLHDDYVEAWRAVKKTDRYLRNSGLFKLSAQGTLNTYALFIERCWDILSPSGRTGMVVPTGIATYYYMQDLFGALVEKHSLLSLFDFENRHKLFPIHRQFRFSLLTIGGGQQEVTDIPMAFYCLEPEEVQEVLELIPEEAKKIGPAIAQLPSEHRLFAFTIEDFKRLNPNTLTSPIFRTRRDAELTKHLYLQAPIFIKKDRSSGRELTNPWGIRFLTMFHMSGDSEYFHTKERLEEIGGIPVDKSNLGGPWKVENELYLPLYEGKMIWFYDHRYNSVVGTKGQQGTGLPTTYSQHKNHNYSPMPRYWVKKSETEARVPSNYSRKWFIGFRDVTNATNERTMVISIIPRTAIGHKLLSLLSQKKAKKLAALLANISSLILDYISRQKIGGSTSMSFFYIEQFPIFEPRFYSEELLDLIVPRVVELIYTSHDMKPFANDGELGVEPSLWDEKRREYVKAELDAIYAHLYKVNRKDLEYIVETFPVLKRNEENRFGEYRTKRLVLEAYDRLAPVMEEFK